jgi:hypothetical protein
MRNFFLIILLLGFTTNALAQHEHHQPTKKRLVKKQATKKPALRQKAVPKPTSKKTTISNVAKPGIKIADKPVEKAAPVTHQHNEPNAAHTDHVAGKDTTDHNAHQGHDMNNMSHAYSLNLPMTRNGSGTGSLPDESPMFGYMMHSRRWMYMIHGNIFLRYNMQDVANKGTRGDSQFDIPNMVMFMGQRRVGQKGLFHFSTMVSFDNVVTGGRGYPLLFQSGETHEGNPLVDRQHPHDLFSEISVSYSHAFKKDLDVFVYLGYPGEPALGPVTFMHRPSG